MAIRLRGEEVWDEFVAVYCGAAGRPVWLPFRAVASFEVVSMCHGLAYQYPRMASGACTVGLGSQCPLRGRGGESRFTLFLAYGLVWAHAPFRVIAVHRAHALFA